MTDESGRDHLTLDRLTGMQKAAILMVAIGPESASQMMKNLNQEDVEIVTKEIAKLRNIPSSLIKEVVSEYHQMILAQNYISEGGSSYAEQLLQRAMGDEQSALILKKLDSIDKEQPKGFKRLQNVNVEQIVNFLDKEHPQTIAVVLAHMDLKKAVTIFEEFSEEKQVDVAYRMARLDRISPGLVEEVEEFLEDHFKGQFGKGLGNVDGQKVVADILNLAGKFTEKSVIDGLSDLDSEIATDIKNLMFVFDDLLILDDRAIQRIMKEVDTQELAVALKGAGDEVKNKVFRNMSERAEKMLRDELEYMGPMRVAEVEQAQKNILTIVSNLEETGDIVIQREGSESDVII